MNVAKIKMTKPDQASRVTSITTRVTPKNSFKTSVRSAKVQVILERHKKTKNADIPNFNPNSTMENHREKIKNMPNDERRNKSISNLSAQPPQGCFSSMISESAHLANHIDKSGISDGSNIKYEQNMRHEDSISEEDVQLIESDGERQESVIINDCNSNEYYLEDQYKRDNIKNKKKDKSKESFYMNAPMQFDINTLRKKVDLPPLSDSYVEISSISKNTPLQSNSSKLMQQFQQKKYKNK
jgi:hypothetical protein